MTVPAHADTTEGSIRPYFELRRQPVATPAGGTADALAYGGGVILGYGLSFSWSLTARYSFDTTRELSVAAPRPGFLDTWTTRRHSGLLGIAWTYSDEYTPVVLLEGGAARSTRVDQQLVHVDPAANRQIVDTRPDESAWLPVARATAYFEWRFDDFRSVAPGAYVEYAGGVAYGARLCFAGYHYLNWP